MAQNKSINPTNTKLGPDKTSEKPKSKPEDIIKPIEDDDDGLNFDFWEDLKDSLPPWIDEVVGITLLIFGILSFISLFIPSEAVVAVAWSNILKSLFGNGGVIVAGALFAFGVALFLPKLGLTIKFTSVQMLAIEIAFLASLSVLHLSNSDVELRALARAGQGGGLMGWGLSFPFYWLLGRSVALMLFASLIIICIIIIIGVQRQQIIDSLKRYNLKLQNYSDRLLKTNDEPKVKDELEVYKEIITSPNYRTNIMRIRINSGNLSPSARAGRARRLKAQSIKEEVEKKKEPRPDLDNHPLFATNREKLTDYNLIGKKTGKKDKTTGYPLVERPDGRLKKYFTVSELKEETRTGRRLKVLPDIELLTAVDLLMPEEDEINHKVVLIENTLLEFDVDIDIIDVQVGPTVTRYAVQPYKADGSERIRLNKIASYSSDLSLALSAKRLRLETPVPGTNYMGIEVPNKTPSTVALRNVLESKTYYDENKKKDAALYIPIGRDVSGAPTSINLAEMPHLLIAGTTGSGKSVCIAALATALLMQNPPDKVKMVMLDPKMVELARFNGIPHLLGPVETDTERIIGVLKWCTREMDRRYKLLEEHSARNIDIYNDKLSKGRRHSGDFLPYMVIMIDEIGDLMMSRPDETEQTITRLAQMARAVGMHMVVATQRPSVDVITGLIKANFPSRIAFSVASGVDSRVILDTIGAEKLLGQGDMLYLSSDAAGPKRIQGCFVSDEEVRAVVDYWKTWNKEQIESGQAEPTYNGPWERGLTRRQFLAETDPMLEEAIEMVVETQEASASMIQRRLALGYPRAARIMDMLEEMGVVGEVVGGGRARKVMIPKGQDPFKRILDRQMKNKDKD
jgi:DNA segregation ATPase FtsK/SpoIIIE, S-DNA-T family